MAGAVFRDTPQPQQLLHSVGAQLTRGMPISYLDPDPAKVAVLIAAIL